MNEFIDGWVWKLTPIHAAVEAFTKGGPECGKAVLKLYADLLEAQQSSSDYQAQCEDLESEVEDLQQEIARLTAEIIKLRGGVK
jgi:peptidoglycan hydrolase CwlO-like protein